MAGANRRLEHERAQRYGTELEAWVIKQSRNRDDPTVTTDEIPEEFDLPRDEIVDRLMASEQIDGKQVGSQWICWRRRAPVSVQYRPSPSARYRGRYPDGSRE